MKKLLLLFVLTAVNLSVGAQTTMSYAYDEGGNIIKRIEGTIDQGLNIDSLFLKTQMVGKYKFVLGPSPTTGIIKGYVENYSGEGVVTAVNVSNGQNAQVHFDSGKFSIDLFNLLDGIYVMHLYIIEGNKVSKNNNLKIIKKSN